MERIISVCIVPSGAITHTRTVPLILYFDLTFSPYLVNPNGQYVLDNKLNRIVIPQKEDNSINQDLLLNTIGTFSFANNSGLIKADNTSFLATEGSGAITALNPGDVELRPYTLEQANVDLGKSMVELLEGQRAFQLNARVVQTADQIEDIVNNLR